MVSKVNVASHRRQAIGLSLILPQTVVVAFENLGIILIIISFSI